MLRLRQRGEKLSKNYRRGNSDRRRVDTATCETFADLRVVVNGYENGYADLTREQLSVVRIALNSGKHQWDGRHGDLNGQTGGEPDSADVVEALVLRRVSN